MEPDVVARNMMLSFEFSRYLTDHPEVEAQVPEGACVVLLPEDDPELVNITGGSVKKNGWPVNRSCISGWARSCRSNDQG